MLNVYHLFHGVPTANISAIIGAKKISGSRILSGKISVRIFLKCNFS